MPLARKQFYITSLIVAALLILVWQIFQFMRLDAPSTKLNVANNAPINNEKIFRSAFSDSQNSYLTLIHRYEIAKIQHKLLKEELAIANTRHAIAMVEQKIRSIPTHALTTPHGYGVQTKPCISSEKKMPNTNTNPSNPVSELLKKPPMKNPLMMPHDIPTHPSSKTRSLDEAVLLEMPAASYTIKIRNSKDKNELFKLAEKYHITDRTLCYTTVNHKQPYYSLVYGDYLTPHAAQSALQALPEELRQNVAISLLSQIQHEILSQD